MDILILEFWVLNRTFYTLFMMWAFVRLTAQVEKFLWILEQGFRFGAVKLLNVLSIKVYIDDT